MAQEKDQAESKEDVGITVKKSEDFSEWYTQLISKAELADIRYNIKGFVVYMPWAVLTIKRMYQKYEEALEKKGHLPIVMPSLIPEKNFYLESEHVEGFTPEVFWVTEHGAGEKFEEKYALRPTSETAFYQMYSYWIRSYKDLPFKRYQSCQVWRCEGKATRPFFRGREFHWIEAHCAFATLEDAKKQVLEDMETTKEVLEGQFAMPFIFFQRPEWDKFAGAVHTYAADALMPSGKVMQLPSTHLLGQNFSKPFNVSFMDAEGKDRLAYITCYGPAISRIYGAMISLHGDDQGLILPFDLAPIQIAIVPILFDKTKEAVLRKCEEIKAALEANYRVVLDASDEHNPGWKFNHYEMKGVPVRIEIGPRDIKDNKLVIVTRDSKEKKVIAQDKLLTHIMEIEKTFTGNLLKRRLVEFKDNVVDATSVDEIKHGIEKERIVRANFCSIGKDGAHCAEVIEKEVNAFVRGKRVDEHGTPVGRCAVCGKPAKEIVYIARSY